MNFKHFPYFVLTLFLIDESKSLNIDRLVGMANIFYQYPGKSQEETLNAVENLKSKENIKVIVHGFLGNRFHDSITPLYHAYMAQEGVDNVFLADWKNAANLDYFTSRKAVANVGVHMAKMLEEFIRKHDIPLDQFHIIGHSLGAHIAGIIGRYFNGSLGRITGLDPALPLFAPNSHDSLQSSDGIFVDVIHTGFPVFGDITPRGTADFYPNYGYTPQMGCNEDALIQASKLIFMSYSCSHNRAVTLYAESIGQGTNFPSIPCTMNAIRMNKSSMCIQAFAGLGLNKSSLDEAIESENSDIVIYMGEHVSNKASGIYYLKTYDAPPYGMGVLTKSSS